MNNYKPDVFRPPCCKFLGIVDRENYTEETEQIDERIPDPRLRVPKDIRYYAVARERDGFSDTPSIRSIANSISSHGYRYIIVERRPEVADENVSEEEWENYINKVADQENLSYESQEALEKAEIEFGFNPHSVEFTNVVFYWME